MGRALLSQTGSREFVVVNSVTTEVFLIRLMAIPELNSILS